MTADPARPAAAERSTPDAAVPPPPRAGDVPVDPGEGASRIVREILGELFGPLSARTFAVRLWDGSVDRPPAVPRFTRSIRHPRAPRRMLLPPTERRLGEAYLRDDVDVEGDLEEAAALTELIAQRLRQPAMAIRVLSRLVRLHDASTARVGTAQGLRAWQFRRIRHSRTRDAMAVRYHYHVGNEFYRLWLDDRMVYSCAYFPEGHETLEEAQAAKLELLCRKLRLRPGERLLDIGCGLGALVLYAAQHYGVQAPGITIGPRRPHSRANGSLPPDSRTGAPSSSATIATSRRHSSTRSRASGWSSTSAGHSCPPISGRRVGC